MKLFIKNMVCNRCKMVVKAEMEKSGLNPLSINLGEVVIEEELKGEEKNKLSEQLLLLGFELIDDKRSRMIERIKTLVVELVHYNNDRLKTNLSDYLSLKLNHDYNYISNLFSEVEGTTIEQYYITQKIERVKELLIYNEYSLSQIADDMNYSSVSHLSKQFKKVTGLTPSYFKQLKENRRKSLDKL